MVNLGFKPSDGSVARKAFPHVRELVIVVGAYFAYMFTRTLIFSDVSVAFDNAERVVALEKNLGLHWGPVWQGWVLGTATGLVVFFNWVYIFTFFPIVITTAIILYVVDRRRYKYFRNVVLVSFVVALVIFMLFPLAPPRMLPGINDTIDTFGPAFYASRNLATYYNAFAAMPSLHFAWTLIFGFMFLSFRPLPFKIFGLLYPTMTLLAITITGNHYILDAVGGGIVMVSSLTLVFLFQQRLRHHRRDRRRMQTGAA
ncbi:MAG: phosphatase PAP2 family protein [Chloroflexi bacterium]|nr:phosphatase PAP2 family protein [Chloroflexota bacterium]